MMEGKKKIIVAPTMAAWQRHLNWLTAKVSAEAAKEAELDRRCLCALLDLKFEGKCS